MKLTGDLIYGFATSLLSERFDNVKPTPAFHREMWESCCSDNPLVAIAAPRGHAKAQDLASKVLTPTGWSTIGELKVGDSVVGADGFHSKVTALHPIEEMDLYRVTTRDGKSTLCNLGHLWQVKNQANYKGIKTKSLEDIITNYKHQRIDNRTNKEFTEYRYKVPPIAPVEFESKDFIIDPYTFGSWLGDGHSAGGRFTTADPEVLDYFPYPTEKQSGEYGYVIREIYPLLKELKVLNNKHIPSDWLLGSVSQRLELLRGLMDTDGTCHRDGNIAYFCNTNKSIIDSTVDLIPSLGGVATVNVNWTSCNGKRFKSWRVSCKLRYNPFKLIRKAALWAGPVTTDSYIVDIKKEKRSEGRCISVERELYITDDYLLTHNSTAVTHSYTLASILFRQSDFVVIISDTELQAIQFLNDIKMELYENQKLRGLFKGIDVYKDAEREIRFKMGTDGHRVRIMARGASGGSGSVRGFKWRGKRPNLVICDDMENDEAVSNEERRAKFRSWFYGALIPALSDTGKIRLVGTVLHFDSLLERLMPPTTGDYAANTVTDGLKQYSTELIGSWESTKYRAHTDFDDFSEILWPEKFTEKRLSALRNDFVRQGIAEGYAQEYLNYPLHEGEAFFRKNDFLPMKELEYESAKTYYAAIDFAISEKDRRSYSVITVGGMDEAGVLHIVDVIRRRMDAKQIIEEMMAVQIKYQPDIFVAEEGALKKAIGPFLKDEMLRRNVFINLHPMVPFRDKVSRARAIQGRMRQGGVHFDMESEWFPAFEQELLRFDRGQYDDQVDSIAWLGLVLNEMVSAPTEQEIADQDWDDEYSETMGSMQMGRSVITGY